MSPAQPGARAQWRPSVREGLVKGFANTFCGMTEAVGAAKRPNADHVACWREEAAALMSAERSALSESSKVLGLGVPVLTAAAGVALTAGHPEVLLALPFMLFLLVTYLLQVYGSVAAMGGARLEIERSLAKALDDRFHGAEGHGERYLPPLVYESVFAKHRTADWSQLVNALALTLALVAIGVVCLWWPHVHGPYSAGIRVIAITLTVLAAAATGFAGYGFLTVRKAVQRDMIQRVMPDEKVLWIGRAEYGDAKPRVHGALCVTTAGLLFLPGMVGALKDDPLHMPVQTAAIEKPTNMRSRLKPQRTLQVKLNPEETHLFIVNWPSKVTKKLQKPA